MLKRIAAHFRSPSMLVALIALALAVTGSATAASLITSKQIKNNSVTSADIRNNSVTSRDIRNRTIGLVDISTAARNALKGQQGPAGPQGPPGPKGDKGDRGPSDGWLFQKDTHTVAGAGTRLIGGIALPAGKYVLWGKATLESAGTAPVSCVLRHQETLTDLDDAAYDPETANSAATVALNAAIDLTEQGTVNLLCFEAGGALTVSDARVSAIRVETLSVTNG